MFKKFKEISAPAVFTKGVMRYKQGHYGDAKSLILKSGEWMPTLKNDHYYKAVLLLVESKLGAQFDDQQFKDALASLENSRYKNSDDYAVVVSDLKQAINDRSQ